MSGLTAGLLQREFQLPLGRRGLARLGFDGPDRGSRRTGLRTRSTSLAIAASTLKPLTEMHRFAPWFMRAPSSYSDRACRRSAHGVCGRNGAADRPPSSSIPATRSWPERSPTQSGLSAGRRARAATAITPRFSSCSSTTISATVSTSTATRTSSLNGRAGEPNGPCRSAAGRDALSASAASCRSNCPPACSSMSCSRPTATVGC